MPFNKAGMHGYHSSLTGLSDMAPDQVFQILLRFIPLPRKADDLNLLTQRL